MMNKAFNFLDKLPFGMSLSALVVLAGLIAAFNMAYNKGHAAGHAQAAAVCANERAQANAQHLQSLIRLSGIAGTLQVQIDEQAADFNQKTTEQINNVIQDYERRMASLSALHDRRRSSTDTQPVRVYIPVKATECTGSDRPGSANTQPAGVAGAVQTHRAELDAQVVADLAGIARDGDIAIIERNDLIERYNAARAALRAYQTQTKTISP